MTATRVMGHIPVPSERLLAATVATHDAFAAAARKAGTAGFAAEFAQRAEYQARIATILRRSRPPVGLESDKLWRIPDVGLVATDAVHPRLLFDHCLRVQDAATLEFCRSYGPNVSIILSSAIQGAFSFDTSCHAAAEVPRAE